MKAEDFMNLSKKKAQDLAEAKNMVFRLIKKDDEDFLPYPEDIRNDRVCVEIRDLKVIKATIQ